MKLWKQYENGGFFARSAPMEPQESPRHKLCVTGIFRWERHFITQQAVISAPPKSSTNLSDRLIKFDRT